VLGLGKLTCVKVDFAIFYQSRKCTHVSYPDFSIDLYLDLDGVS